MLRLWIVALCIGILTSLSFGYIVPDITEVKIRAFVDYSGILEIEDDGIHWIDANSGTAHPGFHDEYVPLNYDENGPTWIDDIPWTPDWFGDGGYHRNAGYSDKFYGDFSWVTGIRLGTPEDLGSAFSNYIFYRGSPDNIISYNDIPVSVNPYDVFYDGNVTITDGGVGAHRYVFYLIPEPATLLTICIGIIAVGCAHGNRFSRTEK